MLFFGIDVASLLFCFRVQGGKLIQAERLDKNEGEAICLGRVPTQTTLHKS